MPIIKSAKKALRSSARKKVYNDRRRKAVKTVVKNIQKSVSEKSSAEAAKLLSLAYKEIDKAAKSGVIKKNTAARKKSRLAKLTKKSS